MLQFLFKAGDIDYEWSNAMWLTWNPSVRAAQKTAEDDLLVEIHAKAKVGELSGRAKTNPRLVTALTQEIDLYYAMYRFQLWAEADYKVTLDAQCCYEVDTKTEYHFYDTYDWHKGLSAGGDLPAISKFKDDWSAALQDAGLAKGYEIRGYFINMPAQLVYTFPTDWLNMNITPPPSGTKPPRR